MKRDWDCIRTILLLLEATGDTTSVVNAGDVPGFDAETASYHMRLMIEARLIEGACSEAIGAPLQCWGSAMTWEGHELLDKIRSPSIWNKIKTAARKHGVSLSLDLVKFLGTRAIENLF